MSLCAFISNRAYECGRCQCGKRHTVVILRYKYKNNTNTYLSGLIATLMHTTQQFTDYSHSNHLSYDFFYRVEQKCLNFTGLCCYCKFWQIYQLFFRPTNIIRPEDKFGKVTARLIHIISKKK